MPEVEIPAKSAPIEEAYLLEWPLSMFLLASPQTYDMHTIENEAPVSCGVTWLNKSRLSFFAFALIVMR